MMSGPLLATFIALNAAVLSWTSDVTARAETADAGTRDPVFRREERNPHRAKY